MIRLIIGIVVLGVAWIVLGRRLAALVDKLHTVRAVSQDLSFLPRDGSTFRLPVGADTLLLDVPVRFVDDRAFLDVDGQPFPLGARSNGEGSASGVRPDSGDRVVYTIEHSALVWPTPLEMNFMTGHAPSFKRHLYHRLRWTKASGEELEMLWRYEQWYYASLGWSGLSGMVNDASSGLVRTTVRR